EVRAYPRGRVRSQRDRHRSPSLFVAGRASFPTRRDRVLDPKQLAELLDRHLQLRAYRSCIERARLGLGPAFEPLGNLACGRHGVWTTENLEASLADDASLQLQLITNPDLQRAVLGLARHQTGQAVRQFRGPAQRL